MESSKGQAIHPHKPEYKLLYLWKREGLKDKPNRWQNNAQTNNS